MTLASRNANIVFNMTNIPVKVSPVMTESRGTVPFKTLHADDMGAAKQRKFCETCDEELTAANTVRAASFANQLVPLTEEEIASTKTRSSVIQLHKFVERPPMVWVGKAQWLAPADEAVLRNSYGIFSAALEKLDVVGFGSSALWEKERPAIIESVGGVLRLIILHSLPEYNDPPLPVDMPRQAEIDAAIGFLQPWIQPLESEDMLVNSDELMKSLVASKATGGEFVRPEEAPLPEPTVDILAALRAMKTPAKRAARKAA
jgi:non-homologous end joining protein Ku